MRLQNHGPSKDRQSEEKADSKTAIVPGKVSDSENTAASFNGSNGNLQDGTKDYPSWIILTIMPSLIPTETLEPVIADEGK